MSDTATTLKPTPRSLRTPEDWQVVCIVPFAVTLWYLGGKWIEDGFDAFLLHVVAVAAVLTVIGWIVFRFRLNRVILNEYGISYLDAFCRRRMLRWDEIQFVRPYPDKVYQLLGVNRKFNLYLSYYREEDGIRRMVSDRLSHLPMPGGLQVATNDAYPRPVFRPRPKRAAKLRRTGAFLIVFVGTLLAFDRPAVGVAIVIGGLWVGLNLKREDIFELTESGITRGPLTFEWRDIRVVKRIGDWLLFLSGRRFMWIRPSAYYEKEQILDYLVAHLPVTIPPSAVLSKRRI